MLEPPREAEPRDHEVVYRVGERTRDLRLDRCLQLIAPAFSRNFWAKAARRGVILVNGHPVRASRVLKEGEELRFWLSSLDRPELLLRPEELGPPIFQDEEVLAFNKPAGMLTHPAGRVVLRSASVLASLQLGEDLHPVHRLDKYTSGLLLLARSADSARAIGERLADRRVSKTYLALSRFQPPENEFVVDLPLDQTGEEHVKLKMLPSPDAKPALTEFTVRERLPQGCLIEARPRTGRQHQIRAHLLAAGAPIVGDLLYGPEEDWEYFDDLDERKHAEPDGRWHALHAWRIRVPGWAGREDLVLEAPLATEFRATLAEWRTGPSAAS